MANWNSYLEGGGLQCEEIIKSTRFCKVHYVLNSDIKNIPLYFPIKHLLTYDKEYVTYS